MGLLRQFRAEKTHLLIFVFTFHKLQEQNFKPRAESNDFLVVIKSEICVNLIFKLKTIRKDIE